VVLPATRFSEAYRRHLPFLRQREEPRAGVPAQYDDGVEWLAAGFRQSRWGTLLGLLLGWTGVWLALWGAVVGLLLGVLAGVGLYVNSSVSTHLFNLGLGESTTFVTAVVGGAIGIPLGFLAVIRFLFLDHPLQAVLQLLSGVLVSLTIVLIAACFERTSLRLRAIVV